MNNFRDSCSSTSYVSALYCLSNLNIPGNWFMSYIQIDTSKDEFMK